MQGPLPLPAAGQIAEDLADGGDGPIAVLTTPLSVALFQVVRCTTAEVLAEGREAHQLRPPVAGVGHHFCDFRRGEITHECGDRLA